MSSVEFENSWKIIIQWLEQHSPGTLNTLNPPATDHDIESIEDHYGIKLPADLEALYRLHNGQNTQGPDIVNFIYGQTFVPVSYGLDLHQGAIADYIEEIDFPNFQNIPKHVSPVKETPLNFFPILSGHSRYALCADFKPSSEGQFGQLVFYDSEGSSVMKVCNSVTELLSVFASDLESGLYTKNQDDPLWLHASKEVDLVNWGYNRIYEKYPNGRST